MNSSTRRFCVACGRPALSDRFPDRCATCGHVEWDNPVPRVKLLVVWEQALVLPSRPGLGTKLTASLPWSYLRSGEHPDAAVERLLERLWNATAASATVVEFVAGESDGSEILSRHLDIYYYVSPRWRAGAPGNGSTPFRLALAELRQDALPPRVLSFLIDKQQ